VTQSSRALAAAGAAAVASGAALTLANPPADLGPVAFIGFIPLLVVLRRASPWRGALLGFVFGLTYFGIVLSWLHVVGVIAWLPLAVLQAICPALFGLLLPLLWRDEWPIGSAVAAAGLWTALDWGRGVWPLGGFTWGGLGYTQHGNGFLLPLASLTGVWGLTFVVVLVNALLLGVGVRAGRRQWGRGMAPALALALAAVLLPALVPVPAATGPRLRVAVVQGNVPRALASDRYLQSAVVAQNHIRLNRSLQADPPDLAVWPENSLDEDPVADPALGLQVSASIRSVGVPTLVGAVTDAPGDRFYNQMLFYSGQGDLVGRYTKIHLVPFGEYVPFRRFLGWVDELRAVPRDLVPGHRVQLFRVKGVDVATPICFENTTPNLFRKFVQAGANLVVLGTNDSSFLLTVASREHVIMSQLRAVENARWIVQAAISGESAIVDPHGRVVAHTGLFTQTILRATVPGSGMSTLYMKLGDWFPWLCGLLVLLFLAFAVARRRTAATSNRQAPPAGEREAIPQAPSPLPIAGGQDPRVLVALPTYNERATIAQVVTDVIALRRNIDVLVIDDSSPDGTGALVATLAESEPRVRLLGRPGKLGLASAYLTGFRVGVAEGYDVIVEMDSDLSHRPEELLRLIDGTRDLDLVIGSRYVPGGNVTNWSRSRVALSKAGNAYARLFLRFDLTDATSGFRAYRREVVEALLADGIHSEGYAFQIELAYRAWQLGFKVGEVPITFREREHGRSKLSRRIVLEALWKVAGWGLRDRRVGTRAPQ
jgi:apolipoprotein N-acyltransferase